VAVAVALGGAIMLSACGSQAPAKTRPTYYLSLGDSLAAGWQPTTAHPSGQVTAQGYANDLWKAERARDPGLVLVKMGCPGETTGTMLHGGICHYAQGSQEDAAVAFIRRHRRSMAFVTIDIGANDVDGCAPGGKVNLKCVESGLSAIRTQVPQIMAPLRAAGGPGLRIVAMNLYDPFLAEYLLGATGKTVASLSVELLGSVNGMLAKGFATVGAPTASVGAAFDSTDTATTTLAGHGQVPVDVAKICTLTWMCAPAPYGPNIHANTDGYQVIAKVLEPMVAAAARSAAGRAKA
jgi:lysophospholipase L1-like esterase